MGVTTPMTLQEAVVHFVDPQVCHDYLSYIRWPSGATRCPPLRFLQSALHGIGASLEVL